MDWAASLYREYPDPKSWSKYNSLAKRDVYRFARLWMSEGVPFVFRDMPMAYERGREAMARVLDEDPKHISMTGSGRLGFSLAPSKFGTPYSKKSDLDLFVVSEKLFEEMKMDAMLFLSRLESGEAVPRSHVEQMHWENIQSTFPSQIAWGFIDQKNIPLVARYPAALRASNALVQFSYRAVGNARGGALYSGASLRVYRNWDRAIGQIGGSLVAALTAKGHHVS